MEQKAMSKMHNQSAQDEAAMDGGQEMSRSEPVDSSQKDEAAMDGEHKMSKSEPVDSSQKDEPVNSQNHEQEASEKGKSKKESAKKDPDPARKHPAKKGAIKDPLRCSLVVILPLSTQQRHYCHQQQGLWSKTWVWAIVSDRRGEVFQADISRAFWYKQHK